MPPPAPPAPPPADVSEAPPRVLQHPPGVLDSPNLNGEDGDFLSTLPRLHLKVEQDLADAVLEFLKSWAEKHPEGKHPNLVHLGADPRVRQCKASVLPREVALRLWIERRLSLGCAASAGSRLAKAGVEVGRDERGMNVVRLSGVTAMAPPSVSPSSSAPAAAPQPTAKTRRHGFAAKSAAPQPPALVGAGLVGKASPPTRAARLLTPASVDASGSAPDPALDDRHFRMEETSNELDDSFDEDPFGEENRVEGRGAKLHSRDVNDHDLAEVAPSKKRKVRKRRRECPVEEEQHMAGDQHQTAEKLQTDPRRTARGAADGLEDDDISRELLPPPEQQAPRERGERARRRGRRGLERPASHGEEEHPARRHRRRQASVAAARYSYRSMSACRPLQKAALVPLREVRKVSMAPGREKDSARRPIHTDPRVSLSAAEKPRGGPVSRSPPPGSGLTLVPRRAVELRAGS